MRYIKTFIGRFQPFHDGHLKCLRAAIDTSDLVVVVIGSAADDIHVPTLKNPWSYRERKAMIHYALNTPERVKVQVVSMQDMPGRDREWVRTVKEDVRFHAKCRFPGERFHYSLVGCHKGAETYYLKLYRPWTLELMPQSEAMNATDVRAAYFASAGWAENIPGSTASYLYAWKNLNHRVFQRLSREFLKEQPK